jgi:hypothetical protein
MQDVGAALAAVKKWPEHQKERVTILIQRWYLQATPFSMPGETDRSLYSSYEQSDRVPSSIDNRFEIIHQLTSSGAGIEYEAEDLEAVTHVSGTSKVLSRELPGQRLRRARERLNLKFRDVELASHQIAERHNNPEFLVLISRLSDLENLGTLPSIYRLYSLCCIYRLDLKEVLEWYGIGIGSMAADAGMIPIKKTHGIGFSRPWC